MCGYVCGSNSELDGNWVEGSGGHAIAISKWTHGDRWVNFTGMFLDIGHIFSQTPPPGKPRQ